MVSGGSLADFSRGRPVGHSPKNKGVTNPHNKRPAGTISPVLNRFFFLLDISGKAYSQVADELNIHKVTLSYWKHGKNSPSLYDFECHLQKLGMKLQIVEAS